jgi:hypothetical protein
MAMIGPVKAEHRLTVFGNRALRGWFGPERQEITGCWRKLHDVEFYNLFSLSDIIRVMKSRRMRWVGHVARMGVMINGYIYLARKLDRLEYLGVDGRILLKLSLKKYDMGVWIGFIWLRIGLSAELF